MNTQKSSIKRLHIFSQRLQKRAQDLAHENYIEDHLKQASML